MYRLKHHEFYIWMIGLILYYGYLGYIIPLHSTDWFWGSDHGMQVVSNAFNNFNGRYISNLLEFASVHSILLRTLSFAFISIFILVLLLRLLNQFGDTNYLILSTVLLFIIPNSLFAQSYGNFEFFYTYVFGTCFSLYILSFIIRVLLNKDEFSRIEVFIFWLICILGQWFAEPLAFYNATIILVGMIYYAIRNHKLHYSLVLGWLLSLCGAMVMLLNDKYIYIFSSVEALRGHLDMLGLNHKFEISLLKDIPRYLFFNNIIILSLIVIILMILLLKSSAFLTLPTIKRIILQTGICILPIYKIFIYEPFNLKQLSETFTFEVINTLLCLIMIVSIAISCKLVIQLPYNRLLVFMSLVSIPISVLPVILITEVSVRQFYLAYLLCIIVLISLISELGILTLNHYNLLKSCILIFAIINILIFTDVHMRSEQRLEDVQSQIDSNKRHITLSHLPYETYLFEITPADEADLTSFKEFHHISEKYPFKILPFEN